MRKVALGCLLLAAASVASAATTYVIANGTSSGGNTISAEAAFTFSTNLLTLTLTNTLANPTTVGQNISDFEFTLASLSGAVTLTPYTGSSTNTKVPTEVFVTGPNFTTQNNGGLGYDPGWAFSYSAGTFALNGLAGSASGPAFTIIGPPGAGGYTNAGGSIAGNGPHNPFIYQTATWVFNISNPTGATLAITNVNFSFGTTAGNDYTCGSPGQVCVAPEPGSWLMLGTGLMALLFFAGKTARKVARKTTA